MVDTKIEIDSNIETNSVSLPSQGAFYRAPFKGLKSVNVRKLSWEDDDILTTKSYYDNGTLFNEILKSTIIDGNGFSYKELTNADKDAILWWLRINAFGPQYTIPHICFNPSCKKTYNATWDLGSFMMPSYPADCLDKVLENGYRTIKLPVSGLEVKVVPPSIGKETDVFKRLSLKKEKLNSSREFNVTGRLLTVIDSATDAEGNVYDSPEKVHRFLLTANKGNRISMIDSRYIQEKAKEIDLAVNTDRDIQCPHCEKVEEEVKMKMSIYFFYPEYLDKK